MFHKQRSAEDLGGIDLAKESPQAVIGWIGNQPIRLRTSETNGKQQEREAKEKQCQCDLEKKQYIYSK